MVAPPRIMSDIIRNATELVATSIRVKSSLAKPNNSQTHIKINIKTVG
jgi:hypothetical protein